MVGHVEMIVRHRSAFPRLVRGLVQWIRIVQPHIVVRNNVSVLFRQREIAVCPARMTCNALMGWFVLLREMACLMCVWIPALTERVLIRRVVSMEPAFR